MKECRECELAIYCYSDSSVWVFRTKQEMEEKQAEMCKCPIYQQKHPACASGGCTESRSES